VTGIQPDETLESRAEASCSIAEGIPFPPLEEGGPSPEASDLRVVYWWAYRGALAAQLTVLALGLFAMTRPRVRAFFSAAAADNTREQEP